MAIATTEPAVIYAGDTLKFKKSFEDYKPEDGWTLSYALVNGSRSYTFSSSDNGDSTHLVNVAPATTAEWTKGEYRYFGHVTDGTDRYKVTEGSIEIKPDFTSVNFDHRSHVKKTLDAIEATLLGKASNDQMQVEINGRSVQHFSPEELVKWRDRYKAEYATEQRLERIEKGLGHNGLIKARFRS